MPLPKTELRVPSSRQVTGHLFRALRLGSRCLTASGVTPVTTAWHGRQSQRHGLTCPRDSASVTATRSPRAARPRAEPPPRRRPAGGGSRPLVGSRSKLRGRPFPWAPSPGRSSLPLTAEPEERRLPGSLTGKFWKPSQNPFSRKPQCSVLQAAETAEGAGGRDSRWRF